MLIYNPGTNVKFFSWKKNEKSILGWLICIGCIIGISAWLGYDHYVGYGAFQICFRLNNVEFRPREADWSRLDAVANGIQANLARGALFTLRPGPVALLVRASGASFWRTNFQVAKNITNEIPVALEAVPRILVVSNLPKGSTLADAPSPVLRRAEIRDGVCTVRDIQLDKPLELCFEAPGARPACCRFQLEDFSPVLLISNVPFTEFQGTLVVQAQAKTTAHQKSRPKLENAYWKVLDPENENTLGTNQNELNKQYSFRTGEHRIRVEHRDYIAVTRAVLVETDTTTNLVVELDPKPAQLIISNSPAAQVVEVLEETESLPLTNNVVWLSPGAHEIIIYNPPRYAPITCSLCVEPNQTYSTNFTLVLKGWQAFTNTLQRVSLLKLPKDAPLGDQELERWGILRSNVQFAASWGTNEPVDATEMLSHLEPSIEDFLTGVNARAAREQKLQNLERAMRVELQRQTFPAYLQTLRLLEEYRRVCGLEKPDATAVLLESDLQKGLSEHVSRRTKALLEKDDFLEVREFVRSMPEPLRPLLLEPNTVPTLLGRIDTEESKWARRERIEEIQDALREQRLVAAFKLIQAFQRQYTNDNGTIALEMTLKRERENQCTNLLLRLAGNYRQKEVDRVFKDFASAGGNANDRKRIENMFFEELLRTKEWSGAGSFIRSLKGALWSRSELAKLDALLKQRRKENRVIEPSNDQNLPAT